MDPIATHALTLNPLAAITIANGSVFVTTWARQVSFTDYR
jgi:hypothetical protein